MKTEARSYPKRLIEVELPIRRISDHARREKYLGTITSLHLWWARRPLAACRAVICAALWPDPSDHLCPATFVEIARNEMLQWTEHERLQLLSPDSQRRFNQARKTRTLFDDPVELRKALLDFIADFADWDNASRPHFLNTCRTLTSAAHRACGGSAGTSPLVLDPFAGGGSIPLEALRVGADAFASDLNPVPVLLNKVVLEYIPKYGQRLADEVRKWGEWIGQEAAKELLEFYPKDKDGSTPIAYLWARTVRCEGPGCGVTVPLIRSLWLAKNAERPAGLQLVRSSNGADIEVRIVVRNGRHWVWQDSRPDDKQPPSSPDFTGTVKRGSVSCPCCGYTTPVSRVREQLKSRRGASNDARLLCVVTTRSSERGRRYRRPTAEDFQAIDSAAKLLSKLTAAHKGDLSLLPDEPTPLGGGSGAGRAFSQRNYGMNSFSDLFTSRQLLAMTTFVEKVNRLKTEGEFSDPDFSSAVRSVLALAVSRESDHLNACCSWNPTGQKMQHLYARQAIPIVWDFCESNPFGGSVGSWRSTLDCCLTALEVADFGATAGTVSTCAAQNLVLPDDSAQAFITDPPYYDAIPYSDLADFFYVWLKRCCPGFEQSPLLTPKDEECIVDEIKGKNDIFFEQTMQKAMAEGRRVLSPEGVGLLVFAHKSTSGWEAQLQAMIDAGWIITASWPIDTELATRLRAHNSASLSSSVHLVCRPRENADGSINDGEIGSWSDVLKELPLRIHNWMPHLVAEGIVGADAIFACLGPALEIFSRYSRVEKANGDTILLKEYLEHVWAAVSKEALSVIFKGASTEGFEPDARLTAMWVWTIAGSVTGEVQDAAEEDANDNEAAPQKTKKTAGFSLDYDDARKIAQGLGAHLESLRHLVELSGNTARLLPVSERTTYLFGKQHTEDQLKGRKPKKKDQQLDLFAELSDEAATEETWAEKTVAKLGETTLDRVHQSMILFAANRGEAMKRFLVEDGAGKDPKFWRLAQALSALYPSQTDEKRWVDGVLARKKGLGL
jgi:putative DNA methylase